MSTITAPASENFAIVPYQGDAESVLLRALDRAQINESHPFLQGRNQLKSANVPAAVIIKAIADPINAFESSRMEPHVRQLAKAHYVVFRTFGRRKDDLGKILKEVKKELGNRAIKLLLLCAHGRPDHMVLGAQNVNYTVFDIKAEDFASLDEKATIFLYSCSTGQHLAREIATVQPRPVYASTQSMYPSHSFFIPCCTEHPYRMIGFNLSCSRMIVKRFHKENNRVMERSLCSEERGMTESDRITRWLRLVEEQGYNLGIIYYCFATAYATGDGVEKDLGKALVWYQKCEEHRCDPIQSYLASTYLNFSVAYGLGTGIGKDLKKAVELCQKAIDLGCASAQPYLGKAYYNLGRAYESGDSVGKDLKKAVECFRKAASQGEEFARAYLGTAFYNLGKAYESGEGIGKDLGLAVQYFEEAADQEYELAHSYLSTAYYNLGKAYLNGEGMEKKPLNAVELLRKAAARGNALARADLGRAFYDLARAYESGEGVGHDLTKAVSCYEEAAIRRCELAQSYLSTAYALLGSAYESGTGVGIDPEKAAECYRKATNS